MIEERDPQLESLFSQAEDVPVENGFTADVMTRVGKRRRNVLIGRLAIVALIVALEILLSAPLQNSVGAMTNLLSTPLFDIDGWLATAIAPLNSVAGLVGAILVGLHFFYRRKVR